MSTEESSVYLVVRHWAPGDEMVVSVHAYRDSAQGEADRLNGLDGPGFVNVEVQEWPLVTGKRYLAAK